MKKTESKSLIRWSGIVIFLVLSALVFAFWYLLLPSAVKVAIEDFGSEHYGAKIDVADVDVNFSPFGLTLTGLAFTDKEQPMYNALELSKVSLQTELLPLLFSKVIVDQAQVSELRFNTPRATSGALTEQTEQQESEKARDQEGLDQRLKALGDDLKQEIPDVDDLLEQEPLLTVATGKKLEQDYKEQKQVLESVKKDIPDEDQFKVYEKRIKALTEGEIKTLEDFTKKKAEFDALMADIRGERDKILAAKEQVSEGYELLKNDLTALKDAPQQDYQRLRDKYSFDEQGAMNLGHLLLGSENAQQVKSWYGYYQAISSVLPEIGPSSEEGEEDTRATEQEARSKNAAKGEYIHFPSETPWPDFWIKRLQVDRVELEKRTVTLKALDISHQPSLINKAIKLSVDSVEQSKNTSDSMQQGTLALRAEFDRRPNGKGDKLDLALNSWPVSAQSLAGGKFSLASAQSDVSAQLSLSEQFLGAFEAQVRHARFELADAAQSDKREMQVLASVLGNINAFDLKGRVSGSPDSPNLSIESDLDQRFSEAFKSGLSDQAKAFEAELKQKLVAKSGDYLDDDMRAALEQLELQNADLSNLEQGFDQLLESKLDSFKDRAEDQAKEKLKEKLGDKFKGLF